MVLIFDLDDTLYDEMSFVRSGLRAVANFGWTSFGWDAEQSFAFMETHLVKHGRGKIFDEWLQSNSAYSISRVSTCIRIYRHHRPNIALYPTTSQVLRHFLTLYPLYLVTDGHKIVQKNKIEALQIAPLFKRTLITHRFGIRHAKPSLHCFDIIRRAEQCSWSKMVYVGDNPAKDFVNLNQQGTLTIRVRTGSYASVLARPGHDARLTIPDLSHLQDTILNIAS
jgi:putative hydrolase of the HAD superfamily